MIDRDPLAPFYGHVRHRDKRERNLSIGTDDLTWLAGGGPTIAERHRAVMEHLWSLDERRLP